MKKKTSYASKLMVVSKVLWALVAIGAGVVGGVIGEGQKSYLNDHDSYYTLLGVILGVAAGVLIGFLLNLFIMTFAEMGQNTKKSADSSSTIDIPTEIAKYKKLLDSNVISQEEFDRKKKDLLNK